MTQPIEIFFSYAHEDESLIDDVRRQLTLFDRQGIIKKWHDRKLQPGDEWKGQIDQRLKQAQIILLFISPHFFDSDYCYDVEMAEAIRRHNAQEARVIPIILRPSSWQTAPFGKLQALPREGKPITKWTNQDEATLNVAEGIMNIVGDLTGTESPRQSAEIKENLDPQRRSTDDGRSDATKINSSIGGSNMHTQDEQRPSIHIGGGIKGQNVVIGSKQTVHGDLTITVGALPAASEDVREMLEKQIKQLSEALKTVPADKTNEVQQVKMAAEDVIHEAEQEQPDKNRLAIRGGILKKAAENLADITPTILKIASQIAETLMKIG